MSKPKLSKEELRSRLENREGRYLYQVDQLTSPAYTQDIFDYVISHELNGELKNIKKSRRESSYILNRAKINSNKDSNRCEEHIVSDLFIKQRESHAEDPIFGNLIEYQVPLSNEDSDNAGKIDFIHLQNGVLYLNEIKAPTSQESLMKAILEIQTYYQIVDHEKLLEDIIEARKDLQKVGNPPIEVGNFPIEIKKCITIFNGTRAYQQYKGDENSPIKQLLKVFDIRVIVLHQNGETLERVN